MQVQRKNGICPSDSSKVRTSLRGEFPSAFQRSASRRGVTSDRLDAPAPSALSWTSDEDAARAAVLRAPRRGRRLRQARPRAEASGPAPAVAAEGPIVGERAARDDQRAAGLIEDRAAQGGGSDITDGLSTTLLLSERAHGRLQQEDAPYDMYHLAHWWADATAIDTRYWTLYPINPFKKIPDFVEAGDWTAYSAAASSYHRVVANFADRAGELNEQAIADILKALPRIVSQK